MTQPSHNLNPKNLFDPAKEGIAGDIGIAGLLVAAMGERVGRGYMLPVYERGKAYLQRIHPRVWAISGIMVSIFMLLLVVYAGLSLFVDDEEVVDAQTINVADALSAPYDLDQRPVLAPDTFINDVLPLNFGDFQRIMDTSELGPFSRLTSCLADDGTYPCDLRYRPQYILATFYADSEGNTIEVMVANYWNDQTASETMVDAVNHARTFSRIGNFVVGIGEMNYFFSTTPDWFTFTWGHGAWIFSISAPNPDVLQAAVQALPY